jgi:hypothetical protein
LSQAAGGELIKCHRNLNQTEPPLAKGRALPGSRQHSSSAALGREARVLVALGRPAAGGGLHRSGVSVSAICHRTLRR